MNKSVKINYRWTIEAFRVLYQLHKGVLLPTTLAPYCMWTMIFGFAVLGWTTDIILFVYISLLYGALWLAWTTLGMKWWTERRFTELRLGGHELHLEASERGLKYQVGMSNSLTDWSEIRRLDETESHIVLWINRSMAFVIPKISFGSDQDLATFTSLAVERTGGNSL